VLAKEPDWERVPAKAQRLLKSCLEKDPKRRLRDIGDAWRLLEDASSASTARSGASWKVATGALAAVSAISIWWAWQATRRSGETLPQPLVQVDLDLGPEISLASAVGPAVILSRGTDRIRAKLVHRATAGPASPEVSTKRSSRGPNMLFAGCGFGRLARY
jgi:serine/threonine-protein kinase